MLNELDRLHPRYALRATGKGPVYFHLSQHLQSRVEPRQAEPEILHLRKELLFQMLFDALALG
jgi:hypothetical protein